MDQIPPEFNAHHVDSLLLHESHTQQVQKHTSGPEFYVYWAVGHVVWYRTYVTALRMRIITVQIVEHILVLVVRSFLDINKK